MKGFLTITALLFVLAVSAQEHRETVSNVKAGTLTCKHEKVTSASGTKDYVYVFYQNGKYKNIVDIGGFMLISPAEVAKLIEDMKACRDFIDTYKSGSYSVSNDLYKLNVYDFAKTSLYITDNDGAYTSITRDQITTVLTWLDTIKLSSSL